MFIVAGKEEQLHRALKPLVADILQTVQKDLQDIKSVRDLTVKTKELRTQVEQLTIEKGRKEEEYARREREVEHKVGLERKRQEFEVASAKREATLAVREENLKSDRARFDEQIKFHEKRFTEEVGYLKDLMTEIMKRLPEVNLSGTVNRKR